MSDKKGGPAFRRNLNKAGERVASWPAWKVAAMRANDAMLSERNKGE